MGTEASAELAARVLFASDRTCCVCRIPGRKTQVHHIDGDHSNDAWDNLAVICFDCHSDSHTTHAFARNLNPALVRLYNDDWRAIVAMRHRASPGDPWLLEYARECYLELELECHRWKVAYLVRFPERVAQLSAAQPLGDVWDALIGISDHTFTPETWERAKPLFNVDLPKLIASLRGLVTAHGAVLSPQVKVHVIRTTRQLQAEITAFNYMPHTNAPTQDKDRHIAMRFRSVTEFLARLARLTGRSRGELQATQ